MYQGTVVRYRRDGTGTIQLQESVQKVKFIFLNCRRIFAGQHGPEFSNKGVLRQPKVGDEVMVLCDGRLTQALLWGYLVSYNRARLSVESRPIYRYMAQLDRLPDFDRYNDRYKTIQIFRGSLNELNQVLLASKLSEVVHDQRLPKRGQLLLWTFWEKSADGGDTWKGCEDPRKLS